MNIFADFTARILAIVETLALTRADGSAVDVARVTVEPPRDASHGDIACNAAMVLAKQAGLAPRALAETIAERLRGDSDVTSVEIAGPGFINLRLADGFWHVQLAAMLADRPAYGRSAVGAGGKVNVEYVSANPTGPMHVGHCRGAIVGDTIANLLDFTGYDVTREYYINDAGGQIDELAMTALLRYREALGETLTEPLPYPGDYLIPVGKALAEAHGKALLDMAPDDALAIAKDVSVAMMMDLIRDDLAALNIHHDVFFSERTLHAGNGGAIRAAINDLTVKGHVYRGSLPPPKGQVDEDWEDREQTLFRSTEIGDDLDRPLIKSDGSYSYFAADVAYMKNKYERGFSKLLFILGADHGGYVKRLQALAKAISDGEIELTVLLCQLVKLYRAGEPVRMSKRAGEFVTLRDVVDEVGSDAVRFMMLFRKADAPLDFDFAKVTEQSKDNPVFYVQYASARCHSVFRQAAEHMPEIVVDRAALAIDLHLLSDAGEIGLVRKLAEYPRLVESAALANEPHRLAFYLYDLASAFHAHWNRGTENAELRFVKVNAPELTRARLGLVQAVLDVLTSGLGLIGADAPEEMR